MGESVQHWVDQSRYDLDTATAMLESGRYRYVLFCCQQAVEKALKAVISQQTGQMPPRIHNLLRLSELAGINLPPKESEFLAELSAYYIQSRYPEEIEHGSGAVTHSIAGETMHATEEIIQWLFSMQR
ncbi:MAG TPA: HEPN domain-containing protein [Candidatus Hydrogenedentes bacterium]|nr:HEPN domain-containing protein [Candidatus Hydrogenedentota bacterium]